MSKEYVKENGLGYDYGRQIVCDLRTKTLICFLNHLEPAPIEKWSQIHSEGDTINGKKRYSNIKCLAQDFSNGKGENSIFVSHNLSPKDVKLLKNMVDCRFNSYNKEFFKRMLNKEKEFCKQFFKRMTQDKISPYTSINITRDTNMRLPWEIEVSQGKAVRVDSYKKKDKYEDIQSISQRYDDDSFFNLITTVYDFLILWEHTFGSALIKKGQKLAMQAIIAEEKARIDSNNGGERNSQSDHY